MRTVRSSLPRTRTNAAFTKQRLLDAGVRLFSEKEFRETTVGDIEAAVGL
ncbi:MAG TPA: hypothetical protein VF942_13300 [Acidimicrobiales bacterium]